MKFNIQLEKNVTDMVLRDLPVKVGTAIVGKVVTYSPETGIAEVEITDKATIDKILKP